MIVMINYYIIFCFYLNHETAQMLALFRNIPVVSSECQYPVISYKN